MFWRHIGRTNQTTGWFLQVLDQSGRILAVTGMWASSSAVIPRRLRDTQFARERCSCAPNATTMTASTTFRWIRPRLDVTPVLKHWSYVFLALKRFVFVYTKHIVMCLNSWNLKFVNHYVLHQIRGVGGTHYVRVMGRFRGIDPPFSRHWEKI